MPPGVETIVGDLVVRDADVRLVNVAAATRGLHPDRRMSFFAPAGSVKVGDVVDLIISGVAPRIISAKVDSLIPRARGDRGDHFDAVLESDRRFIGHAGRP